MRPGPLPTFALRRPLGSLILGLSALYASACRDVNVSEPKRAPGAALAAKSGIPDSLPLRIDEHLRAGPNAPRVACGAGISVPGQLVAEGVIAPHMGRTRSVVTVLTCQVTNDAPHFWAVDTVVGATGDSLFGDWMVTISNMQNGKATLDLEIVLSSGSGWFGNATGAATGKGVLDLASGAGSYTAKGTIGPRPVGPPATGTQVIPETISEGYYFACGIAVTGEAYCWGMNTMGQLGDGSNQARAVPTPVAGQYHFTQIAAGLFHACGLTPDGAALCWGLNTRGQLGTGDDGNRTLPSLVSGMHTFTHITAGDYHTCGTTALGTFCWGENFAGELGDGSTTNSNTPTRVHGGLTFTAVSAGGQHTCGLTTLGAAYCWGYNANGQLGDGTASARNTPTQVVGAHNFVSISAGSNHTCALRYDSVLAQFTYCWGANSKGQLGDGTSVDRAQPTLVVDAPAFVQISAGSSHTCAVSNSLGAYCWGENAIGQLGDGTTIQRLRPTAVSGGSTFRRISANNQQTCAIAASGVAYCWGTNSNGVLGYGGSDSWRSTPTPVATDVPGGLRFARLTGASAHACGLTSTGLAYCWGANSVGQVGDGSTIERHAPTAIAGYFNDLSAGGMHTCAVRGDGTPVCWGSNEFGQLGDGTTTDHALPAPITSTVSFYLISAGGRHTCAIAYGGAVYCWGSNESGQLGDGGTTNHYGPTLVASPYGFDAIAAGDSHTCGRTYEGAVYCWGDYGGVNASMTPVLVPVAAGEVVVALEAGDRTTCALTFSNNVYCWGANAHGQLGDGTTSNVFPPKRLIVETDFSWGVSLARVGVGANHVCVVANNTFGELAYCSGWNYYGQLGDNSTVEQHNPVAVYGDRAFQSITGGGDYTCALSSGVAYCWGRNQNGQLGTGDTIDRKVPAAVTRLLFKM
ncbi:MAG TPA: hypothetical protein VLN49_01185 [Gemmatimonadaceae bacterium]|nr:hypothetical protein [Gemmatimonadaceae bacterium]